MPTNKELEKRIEKLDLEIREYKQEDERRKFQRDLAIELANAVSLHETLHRLLINLLKLDEFNAGAIYLIDEKTGGLHLKEHVGFPQAFVDTVKYYDKDDIRLKIIKEGKPLYQNFNEFPDTIEKDINMREILSLAVIPVKNGEKVIGAINLASHTHDIISENTKNIFESISRIEIGQSISRAFAEDALRASEEKFSKAFHCGVVISGISDLKTGSFIEVNQTFYSCLGFTPEEVIGKKSSEILLMDEDFRNNTINDMMKQGYIRNIETIIFTKNKEPRNVLLSAEIIEIDGIQYNYSNAIDITELKQMEISKLDLQDRLNRSKKMESLGLMAGGVAHDLNNILTGIVSFPELLLKKIPKDSDLRESIEIIHGAGLKAAAIVSDLITIARGVASHKEPVNINDTVKNYLDSSDFQDLKKHNPGVIIDTRLDSDLLNIFASQIHIRKVTMNLVSNAMEAINDTGTVTISTSNQYIDRPLKKYDEINTGEYAVLTVSDNGSGISPLDLERIFEPFYTKKIIGRSGTGLGLAVVWSTIQDHNGYIDVSSSHDSTIFKLYFPITREKITKEQAIPFESYRGNGEKILVIDDEENQRAVLCQMLDILGYEAVSVSSGENAVEYLKDHKVDLLLLDMIMDPGINGSETLYRIKKNSHNQRAIIVSGFAETKEVAKAQELGAKQFLKKPLMLEALGVAVKKELNIN